MTDVKTRPSENWHSRARFGVHFDLYAGPGDTRFGRDVTYQSMRREIERLQPGFVHSDCKGTAGFANYWTKVGTPSPGLVVEKLGVLREVTRDLGLPLGVAYAGLWDAEAVKRHPGWARIDENGKPGPVHNNIGAVAQLCPSSGYVDDLMIPMLLEVIDRFDVDGFWIDADGWGRTSVLVRALRRSVREPPWQRAANRFVGRSLGRVDRRQRGAVRRVCNQVHRRRPSVEAGVPRVHQLAVLGAAKRTFWNRYRLPER